ADGGLHRVGRAKVGRDLSRGLPNLEGGELRRRRHRGKEVEHGEAARRRVGDDELLLVDAVEARGLEREVLAEAREEDAEAAAHANLGGRESPLPEELRAPEALDARDVNEHGVAARVRGDLVVGVKLRREAAAEGERAGEVLRRHVAYAVKAKARAGPERV